MGANASRGTDNQSLVDKILDDRHPLPPDVERALRLVDRGDYFEKRSSRAYIDLAWRSGHIHLSAPSIYLSVLRHLDLAPGHRFLNIGSGSGYLNTIVGLLLGYNGVNHGIELIGENVEFAQKRLQSFLSESDAPLERDFCTPQFVHGNIFHLLGSNDEESNMNYTGPTLSDGTPSDTDPEDGPDETERNPIVYRSNNSPAANGSTDDVVESNESHTSGYCVQMSIDSPPSINFPGQSGSEDRRWPTYDRIYVGAAVRNKTHLKSILRFLEIGGVLVAPLHDELVKITRVSVDRLRRVDLMSVSFAPLIIPQRGSPTPHITPPFRQIPSLSRLCGRLLRGILRTRIEQRRDGLPVLGRYHEVDADVERKRPRRTLSSADGCEDSRTFDDPSSSCQTTESDSDHADGQTVDRQNGHASSSSQSDHPDSPSDFLMRFLLRHSWALPATEEPHVANNPSGNRGEESSIEPDTEARLPMFRLLQDHETEDAVNDEPSMESHIHVRARVANRILAVLRENTNGPTGDHGQEDTPTNSLPTAQNDPPSSSESTEVHRRKSDKKRRLKYQPSSYRYRDDMRNIMSKELNLPELFIKDAFLLS